jgi:hypothetical protein
LSKGILQMQGRGARSNQEPQFLPCTGVTFLFCITCQIFEPAQNQNWANIQLAGSVALAVPVIMWFKLLYARIIGIHDWTTGGRYWLDGGICTCSL